MVTTCIVLVSDVQTGSGGMLVSVVPVYTYPCAAPKTAIAMATRRIVRAMPSAGISSFSDFVLFFWRDFFA